jgi:hypothetical protein
MDGIKIKGTLDIEHVSNGNVMKYNVPNTILDVGKSQIAGLIVSDLNVGSRFDWMSIGLGSSTISGNQLVLGSEYIRVATAGSTTTGSSTNNTAQFIGSFGIGSDGKTINEAAIFNSSASNAGSILSRTTFANIVASSGDQINIAWKVAFD